MGRAGVRELEKLTRKVSEGTQQGSATNNLESHKHISYSVPGFPPAGFLAVVLILSLPLPAHLPLLFSRLITDGR